MYLFSQLNLSPQTHTLVDLQPQPKNVADHFFTSYDQDVPKINFMNKTFSTVCSFYYEDRNKDMFLSSE